MKYSDVCIIGAGASGLAAAASLDDSLRVIVLEKNSRPALKVRASGGGRCNITNRAAAGASSTIEFFRQLGLELHCDEEGRFYPYSNQAADVAEVLEEALRRKNNTEIYTGFSAGRAEADGGKFLVSDGKREVRADRLIIACGGKSCPSLGTTGDGYTLARKLGHTIRRVYPILTPIQCRPLCRGVRARGIATLLEEGRPIAREAGEIQFTEDGLSGICIFNLTYHMRAKEGERPADAMERYQISLDLAPDFTEEEVRARETSFGIVTGKLADRIPPSQLKDFRLQVTGTKGWKQAQCTAGGVSLEEIEETTQESRIHPGLYFTGEVLDIQYPCGGFNLQNAWETGRRAAAHINRMTGTEAMEAV